MKLMHLQKIQLLFACFLMLCLLPAHSLSLSGKLDLKYPHIITSFYPANEHLTYWADPLLREEFENQLSIMATAQINEHIFNRYRQLKEAANLKNWQDYEYLASDTLIFYLSYLEQLDKKGVAWLFGGRVEDNLEAPAEETINMFFAANLEQTKLQYLQERLPLSEGYKTLYQRYIEFQQLDNDNREGEVLSPLVKNKLTLEQKETLIQRLHISGDISLQQKQQLLSEEPTLFSPQLVEIVKQFQARHGLVVDGIIGKNTRYWINLSYPERLRLMALNLLRVQLWGTVATNKIIVNIPSFEMQYWEDDQKIFESKIIVGRSTRRTPLFTTRLDSIIFNPNWKVPNSIMRKDILPKVLVSPEYLNKNKFEIVDSWKNQDVIDPEQIDWETMSVDKFPYKLRQRSGKSSTLGEYKFNTPNKNAIYLHDTSAKHLFNRQYRAYSSGCIRVKDSEKFAKLLMKQSGFTQTDFHFHDQKEETNSVALKQLIKVKTIYQTVWVNQQGITQFRRDIYHYDKARSEINIKN